MNHVVFFRFDSLQNAHQAASKLRALAGVVPTLDAIEVGIDELRTPRSWDLCLICRFADQAAMEAYQVHPAHQAVVSFIKAHATGSAAVDWT